MIANEHSKLENNFVILGQNSSLNSSVEELHHKVKIINNFFKLTMPANNRLKPVGKCMCKWLTYSQTERVNDFTL